MVPCAARGVVLLDALAGRRDAARMERREDRARPDGVHTNAVRRVVGGEPPPQARDRGLTLAEQRSKLAIRGLSDRE
jgi:hypothetical protein